MMEQELFHAMWRSYINATDLVEVLQVLAQEKNRARIVAGGTDIVLEMERGARRGIETLVDVTRIAGLDQITLDESGVIHIGPLVTHNHCVSSKLIQKYAFPLAQACLEVGSPQIRNRGTIAGNLITASPANDTITPLMALGASVTLKSTQGDRSVPLTDFYRGVRKTVMNPDEMLVDISFRGMQQDQRGCFIKLALRRAQAISLVNVAVITKIEGQKVKSASITLGAVSPTIIHAAQAEAFLVGRSLDEETIEKAATLTMEAARPISDVRSSAGYRRAMVKVITRRSLKMIAHGIEKAEFPEEPILLWGKPQVPTPGSVKTATHVAGTPIHTMINGKPYTFESGHDKTLLRLLREEGELIGTKEGCAEGECGACTVFLDGIAVMSCMVPAPRAHGAEIVTIEGLATNGTLHPVQQAFINHGAVQCGYCTPGFLMSAVKLLEEQPHPSRNQISQALTGNLCRCTGYYKIIQAIEETSRS
jgi:xanthine dehydrogenase iron-sulfur cluster and FAD-binding subunit A